MCIRDRYDNLYPSRIIVGTDPNDPHLVEAAHTFAGLLQEGAIKQDVDTCLLYTSDSGDPCGFTQKIPA